MLLYFTSSCNGLYSDYYKWTPKYPPTKEYVYCPLSCNDSSVGDKDQCCLCDAKHKWELANGTDSNVLFLLDLEYISVKFSSNLTVDPVCKCLSQLNATCKCNSPDEAIFQGVFHRRGYMKSLPLNICEFPKLTHIDFSYNRLQSLTYIGCLSKLDSLVLHENRIAHLSNETFVGMTNLRIVTLANNRITSTDVNLFSHESVGLFKFDISNNSLKSLDISNFFVEKYEFCVLKFSNNIIVYTDKTDFYFNVTSVYNSGDIDVSAQLITTTQDPLTLIINKQQDTYHLIYRIIPKGNYDFKESSIFECDCVLGNFLQMSKHDFKRFRMSAKSSNLTLCHGPPGMVGFDFLDVYDNNTLLELFTCNQTSDELCPKYCKCTDISTNQQMIVDCRNTQKYELPRFLPTSRSGYNYVLRLDDNFVKTLPARQYFTKLYSLDMSNNAVTHLSDDILNNLETMTLLNVSGHSLVELPKRIQTVKIERIYFGHNPVPCNCDNLWIGEWRRRWNAGLENPLYCQLDGGEVKLADYVTDSYLECGSNFSLAKVLVSVSIPILLVLFCLFAYYFRYEVMVIINKFRTRNKINVTFEWDCYISFDEEDPGLREFVLKDLEPKLSRAGFQIFVPCKDLPVGGVIENDMKNYMHISKCFLFILTKDFGSKDLTEYNIAQEIFFQQPSRIIIILNYDNMPLSSFKLPKFRSFKRFSHYIEVVDRQRNIFNEITTILGRPLSLFYGNRCRDEMHNKRTVYK